VLLTTKPHKQFEEHLKAQKYIV